MDKAKLALYSIWAKERLDANEDPRDVLAFLRHLKEIGADFRRPEDYGLPFFNVAGWAPMLLDRPSPSSQGDFVRCPKGFLLHSSRSGVARSELDEFHSTVNYAVGGADGKAWNATIGPGIVAQHLSSKEWGWNARSPASYEWVAVEFSQGLLEGPIADSQVDAFCWYAWNVVRPEWPDMPFEYVTHSQLAAGIVDGKTDPVPKEEAPAFIARVEARMAFWPSW